MVAYTHIPHYTKGPGTPLQNKACEKALEPLRMAPVPPTKGPVGVQEKCMQGSSFYKSWTCIVEQFE